MRQHRRAPIAATRHDPWWNYLGAFTQRTVTVDGVPRTLLTLKGNGDLIVLGDLWADLWMCGCGATGGDAIPGVKAGDGGGGGYWLQALDLKLATCPVTVPKTPSGATLFMGLQAASAKGKAGGSGGGAGGMIGSAVTGGAGSGASGATPFGLTALFQPHCAGGGGGGFHGGSSGVHSPGGHGGGSGASGGSSVPGTGLLGGAGGVSGGGLGGDGFTGAPTAYAHGVYGGTTQYGSGGGGGGGGLDAESPGLGGAGTQGIVYLLLK